MNALADSGARGPDQQLEAVWQCLERVLDPEIPVVSIVELGIVRDVRLQQNTVEVDVAPTYSGCPATELIEKLVSEALENSGFTDARVKRVLSPPWTTDWISADGRAKLLAYGIAPPAGTASKRAIMSADRPLACPRCGSAATHCVSQFGSTACKASYRCDDCLEPFEYFKCL